MGDKAAMTELQLRADRGFVDAAGYAKLAAHAMAPLCQRAVYKLRQAKASGPDDADRLGGEARDLMAQAAAEETKYLAPVLGKAHEDAAFGIGALFAMHAALAAEKSGSSASFDAAFRRAATNVRVG